MTPRLKQVVIAGQDGRLYRVDRRGIWVGATLVYSEDDLARAMGPCVGEDIVKTLAGAVLAVTGGSIVSQQFYPPMPDSEDVILD
jgi:hypothetical protein